MHKYRKITHNNKINFTIRFRICQNCQDDGDSAQCQNQSLAGYPNELQKRMHDTHCHGMVCVGKVLVHQHGDVGLDDGLLGHDEAKVPDLEVVLFCLLQ